MNKTLEYVLLISITIVIAVGLSFISRRILNVLIRKNSKKLGVKATSFIFIKNSISFVIYTAGLIWIFYKIPYFKSLGSALFAGAGVFAAVMAFASQKAFANIIGGVFILIFKPFRVGDVVEISNNRRGIVEEITLRHTVIRDYESRRVIIPNSMISDETIVNSSITDEKIRKHIEFGISYDSNIDLARKIIYEEIEKHPLFMDNRSEDEKKEGHPKLMIRLVSLGDFSVVLKAYVWAKNNDDAFVLTCDVLESVKKRFDREGIEIPFPYRTVVFKNKEEKKINELK